MPFSIGAIKNFISLKKLRFFFGLILLFILVWYFDFKTIIFEIANMDFYYIFLAAIFITLFTILGAYNTYLLINLEKKLTFFNFIPIYWISWAVALVFPGQVGDIATLSVIMKKRGLDISKTVGRSLIDKLISFILMLGFAVWGILTLPNLKITGHLYFLVLVVTIFLLIYWQRIYIAQLLRQIQPKLMDFMIRTAQEVQQVTWGYPRLVMTNIVLTCVKIGLAGTSYWYAFQAIGYTDVVLWRVIPLVAISSLVAYLPISFNGIGTAEISGVVLFSTMGIAEASVLSAYLSLRCLGMIIAWGPLAIGLLIGHNLRSR
ncbi:MAG: lysylphosphatidylglycerol synthase transmembrane domain-containing protein [Candidatus Contendobacter sp.]|mgnify:CR=1 FL=1|nr:lysylphosphatidylglycerol synthase transmembrane domain-containing protein [Candidatus Contendobacter sp.]